MAKHPKLTISKTAFMKAPSSYASGSFGRAASNDNGVKPTSSDASIQARRNMGDKIGELAKDYFPEGVEIPANFRNTIKAEQQTRDLIAAGETVLFEAAAIHPQNGAFCRLDALRKVEGSDAWDMIEVKSSTKAKPEHIEDLAFQRYVFEAAGYTIRDCFIMCVDNTYEAGAEIDPQGFFKLEDVTSRVETKMKSIEPKLVQLIAHKEKRVMVNEPALCDFLDEIEYPIYYLDYEGVMNGIPLYEGTRPYQQVPFQFSLHIQEEPNGPLEHISFLHKERSDPRLAFTEALIEACGSEGSVIVFFEAYEATRNKELARDFPEYAAELEDINARIVDIHKPFQQRLLYDPAQKGRTSIKVVLPAFTDISYDGMAIANGDMALQEYMAFATGFKTDPQEIEAMWDGLEEYCEQDTYAMVALLDVLHEKADYDPSFKMDSVYKAAPSEP